MAGVQHLMFLGSSCIYPRDYPQPIRGAPHRAARAGQRTRRHRQDCRCQARGGLQPSMRGRHYVSVMPTNLYGPNDNYDLATSRALTRKARGAKVRGDAEYVVWGTETQRRGALRCRRPRRRPCAPDGLGFAL